MTEATITLLLQIPLAGVVVVVVVLFLKFLRDYYTAMIAYLGDQEKATHSFLREQREQTNEAVGRLAEEMKGVAQEVARLNGVIIAHDTASKTRAEVTHK